MRGRVTLLMRRRILIFRGGGWESPHELFAEGEPLLKTGGSVKGLVRNVAAGGLGSLPRLVGVRGKMIMVGRVRCAAWQS